jgi:hypothetical protein
MSDLPPTSEDLLRLISAATANFKLTAAMVEIVEWDRASPINGIDAARVIETLEDPSQRPIPETRPCILRVIPLDVVLCVQRCIFETGAPIYSDADVQRVLRWMRATLLPELLANPSRVQRSLSAALSARLNAELVIDAEAGADEPEPGMFDFVAQLAEPAPE